jgi:phosphoketolase
MTSATAEAKRTTGDNRTALAMGLHSAEELRVMDNDWRAFNYLSAGQINLMDNSLDMAPLPLKHAKPRLPGDWGTASARNPSPDA